jgi:probable phosphoglycerate mutase
MVPVTDGSEQLTRAMHSLEAAFLIGLEGVTEIWLIRHADCYFEMTDRTDPPLSSIGRDQAARLAKRMQGVEHAAVFSSPYQRAIETAKAIGYDVQVDDRLVEMALEVKDDGSLDLQEPPKDVLDRMRSAVDEMIALHPGERVIAVSHGMAIMSYLTDVLHLEPGHLRMYPYFTSISIVRALGDRRMIGALGDVAHLE